MAYIGSTHHARFADPLTVDEMRRAAPSIFAPAPHDSRSARYAYIPTIDVLQGLQREGFEVFSASQSRTRLADRREFTKHLVRLRHVGAQGLALQSAHAAPEIVLINSHDGSSAYRMMSGCFRMVCANGLIVPESLQSDIKIQHTGQILDRVTAGAFEILDGLTRVVEDSDAMRALTLNDGESAAFARAALMLRYDPDDGAPPITERQILAPRRIEDRASDLWTTFNRVQENVIRGGIRAASTNGRRMRTRAVTGIDQDVKLNRALWALADEMRKLKS
jgi:hypothetical protein